MTDSEYGAIVARRLTGSEPLTDAGHPVGPDLSQFWAWSASDLVGNTARGVLAEFVVAHALGLTAGHAGITDGVRPDWTPWDLTTPSGIKIEVKSSAFIQSWEQRDLSRPSFGIAPRRAWDPVTGTMNPEPQHHADVFVFALLAESNQASIDPLELSQWQFYVVPPSYSR